MRLFVLLAVAMPLAAQCSFVFSPSPSQGVSVPAAGGSGTVTVNTSPYACGWAYGSDSSWITVGTGSGSNTGSGNAGFPYSVSQNFSPATRQGNILVSDGIFTYAIPVTQAAASCSLNLPTASTNVLVAGGSGSFQVQTGCYWNVYGVSQTWITVPANTNGTGNGSVSYTAAANACVAGRTGAITVQMGSLNASSYAGFPTAQFTLTQAGSNSNLTLSPTSAVFDSTGGTGTIRVSTGDDCAWGGIYSTVSWISITSQSTSSGSGVVSYKTLANTSSPRTGTILIGPQTFTVTQQGAAPPVPQVNAVLNAASYSTTSTAVAPGEIVALFGTNLGPTTGVGLQLNPDGKSVATTLGGTQVLFDGVAAPLTYASATQVNAVVPFRVSGSTNIQVSYQGMASTGLKLPVQAAAPGIFTLDGDGIGNGAILNQDGSINTKTTPAAIGSVVQIFSTGGGATDPPSTDGSLSTANNLVQPVTVTIGGQNAQVKYSGGAPGAIAGALQINAVVPAGVASGGNVPIVVQIGNWQSQANVTMAVQ